MQIRKILTVIGITVFNTYDKLVCAKYLHFLILKKLKFLRVINSKVGVINLLFFIN